VAPAVGTDTSGVVPEPEPQPTSTMQNAVRRKTEPRSNRASRCAHIAENFLHARV
jgi:hypothetical protein